MTRDEKLSSIKENRRKVSKTGQSLIENSRTGKPQENYRISYVADVDVPTGAKIIRGAKKPILNKKGE